MKIIGFRFYGREITVMRKTQYGFQQTWYSNPTRTSRERIRRICKHNARTPNFTEYTL